MPDTKIFKVDERTKLWLDDIRRPPDDSWIWARTIEEAQLVVMSSNIKEASLDHDMGLHEFDPDAQDADRRRIPRRYRCYCCRGVCYEVAINKGPELCPICGETEPRLIDEPDGVEFAHWLVMNDNVPTKVVIHSHNHQKAGVMADILRSECLHIKVEPYERPVK